MLQACTVFLSSPIDDKLQPFFYCSHWRFFGHFFKGVYDVVRAGSSQRSLLYLANLKRFFLPTGDRKSTIGGRDTSLECWRAFCIYRFTCRLVRNKKLRRKTEASFAICHFSLKKGSRGHSKKKCPWHRRTSPPQNLPCHYLAKCPLLLVY